MAVLALHALDLPGDEVERLVPADAHVAGLAPVLRIALAVGVEVDAAHRVEQAVLRVHHRLRRQRVRRRRGPPWRREHPAARLDAPWLRIVRVEVDRRDAHDAPVLHVHEHRAAVGSVDVARLAVAGRGADLPAHRTHDADRLGEPARELVVAADLDVEVLGVVHRVEPLRARTKDAPGHGRVAEGERHIGFGVQAGSRAHARLPEEVVARGSPCIAHAQLDDLVAAREARGEVRMSSRGPVHEPLRALERCRHLRCIHDSPPSSRELASLVAPAGAGQPIFRPQL